MSQLPPLADFRASSAPAVVILGNDAVLAARPATPVQLAHACLAAGFRAVIPASWGDELVADATLDALTGRATRPAIHCSCPHVARRVLAVGSELAPHLVSLVAPPVAAARYLRLHSAGELRVTYAGRCPAAADDSIDARLTPEELLAQLADRGIDPTAQPEVFESVIPPDRRRHLSVPGGLPSPEMLWSRDRFIVETMKSSDFASELADLLLARREVLIDPAPSVGCVCSGAIRGAPPNEARMSVVALEPPRSAYPVVDDRGALSLELPLPMAARDAADLVAEPTAPLPGGDARAVSGPAASLGDAPPPPPPVAPNRRPRLTPPGIPAIAATPPAQAQASPAPPRRRSPTGTPRVVPGAVPVSSDSEGRILPRAYVARRRSPRSGVPVVTDPPAEPRPGRESIAGHLPPTGESAPRHTVPVSHPEEPPRVAADSERPVVRSVEPATVHAPATPAVIDTGASPSGRASVAAVGAVIGARMGRGVALLRTRSWLLVAGAIAGTGLLLGVAIGYTVAHRRASAATATGLGRGVDSLTPTGSRAAGVRESVSAGGIAPLPGASRRAAARTQARPPATAQRPAARAGAPRVEPRQLPLADGNPAGSAAGAVPPTAAAASPPAAVGDSAAPRARRDSVARVESLATEREAIREEIERRRARLDSIQRARLRLDSIQRADENGNRPPPR